MRSRVTHRTLLIVRFVAIVVVVVFLLGCPKDPYRASIQGSADVAQAVASAIKITSAYYTAGTIGDTQKARVATYLNLVTDCNTAFRHKIEAAHVANATGVSVYLPVADALVQCVAASPNPASADPKVANILKAVDTALNGVSLAVASAKQ